MVQQASSTSNLSIRLGDNQEVHLVSWLQPSRTELASWNHCIAFTLERNLLIGELPNKESDQKEVNLTAEMSALLFYWLVRLPTLLGFQ